MTEILKKMEEDLEMELFTKSYEGIPMNVLHRSIEMEQEIIGWQYKRSQKKYEPIVCQKELAWFCKYSKYYCRFVKGHTYNINRWVIENLDPQDLFAITITMGTTVIEHVLTSQLVLEDKTCIFAPFSTETLFTYLTNSPISLNLYWRNVPINYPSIKATVVQSDTQFTTVKVFPINANGEETEIIQTPTTISMQYPIANRPTIKIVKSVPHPTDIVSYDENTCIIL